MRNIKKAIKFSLAIVLLLAFSACSNVEKDQKSPSNPEPVVDADEISAETQITFASLPAVDYGGAEIIIANLSGYDWCDVTLDVEAENTGEMLNDAIYRRNRAVEEKYNVILNMTVNIPSGEMANKVKNLMLSGYCDYDLIQMSMREISKCAVDNYIADANLLKNLNLSNPWWDHSANASMSICGRQFFVFGDFTIADKEYAPVIYFNKVLQQTYSLPDYYQIVREGKWTQAVMLESMKAATVDLNGDGKMTKDDQYGLSTNTHQSHLIFCATGATVVKKDSDDMPYWTVNDEYYLEAFVKTWNFLNTDNTTGEAFKLDSHQDQMFANGKALFDASLLAAMRAPWDYQHSMEQEFGVLPTPKLDENQEQYVSPMHQDTPCMAILNNDSDRVERACIIFAALTAKSSEDVQPKYKTNALPNKCFRDEESFEMLDIILNNRIADLAAIFQWGGLETKMQETLNSKSADKAVSTIEQYFQKADTAMKTDIEKIIDLDQ